MKIKRPLINQYYEDENEKPEEQVQEPLVRPSFGQIKPLEQVSKEVVPSLPEQIEEKEVVIQTKPSEEFLRWKAQAELEAKAKAEADAKALEAAKPKTVDYNQIERTQEYIQPKPTQKPVQQIQEPALPKTAVRAEDMPQATKIVKKVEAVLTSEDQLEFGITPKKITFEQRIRFLRMYFERRQELLEISMLWKNPSLPFNIISVIFVIGLLFIGGIFEFDKIPLKIPLFYNHVEKSWEQTDKSTVFIMGIILLVTEGFLINLIIKIFKSDRRLALTLSWVITFINVLIIIASLQIYSLIT